MAKWKQLETPLRVAFITSVVILLGFCVVFLLKGGWKLSANEIGDFSAGLFGSVSVVWLVAAILLQREELSLQRHEISRLSDESKRQSVLMETSARESFLGRYKNFVEELLELESSFLAGEFNQTLRRIYDARDLRKYIWASQYVNAQYENGEEKPDLFPQHEQEINIDGIDFRFWFHDTPVVEYPRWTTFPQSGFMHLQARCTLIHHLLRVDRNERDPSVPNYHSTFILFIFTGELCSEDTRHRLHYADKVRNFVKEAIQLGCLPFLFLQPRLSKYDEKIVGDKERAAAMYNIVLLSILKSLQDDGDVVFKYTDAMYNRPKSPLHSMATN